MHPCIHPTRGTCTGWTGRIHAYIRVSSFLVAVVGPVVRCLLVFCRLASFSVRPFFPGGRKKWKQANGAGQSDGQTNRQSPEQTNENALPVLRNKRLSDCARTGHAIVPPGLFTRLWTLHPFGLVSTSQSSVRRSVAMSLDRLGTRSSRATPVNPAKEARLPFGGGMGEEADVQLSFCRQGKRRKSWRRTKHYRNNKECDNFCSRLLLGFPLLPLMHAKSEADLFRLPMQNSPVSTPGVVVHLPLGGWDDPPQIVLDE